MADHVVTGPAGRIERRLRNGMRTGLLIVTVTVHLVLSVVPSGDRHGWTWPDIVAFVLMGLVCGGGAFFVVCREPLSAPARWTGVVILLLSSAVVSAALPLEPVVRAEHWSFGTIGWYGLFLLCDLPLTAIATFIGAHVLLSVGGVLFVGAPAAALAQMAITVVSVPGFQLGIGMAAGVLRRIASSASESAAADESLRTKEIVAETIHRDHAKRHARLLETTMPLLAGLAAGSLDHTDETVRRRCAIEAARLRRLFAESDDTVDPLVHELSAAIDIAERHGICVRLAVCGDPPALSPQVRQELLEPISAVLVMAASSARVTVLYGQEGVRVSVIAEVTDRPPPCVVSGHVDTAETVNGSSLWMETVWRRDR